MPALQRASPPLALLPRLWRRVLTECEWGGAQSLLPRLALRGQSPGSGEACGMAGRRGLGGERAWQLREAPAEARAEAQAPAPVGKRADGDSGDSANEQRGRTVVREDQRPEAAVSVSQPSRRGRYWGLHFPKPQPECAAVAARLPRPGLGAAPRASPRLCECRKQGPSGVSPRLDRLLRDLGSMDVSVLAPTPSPLWASIQ